MSGRRLALQLVVSLAPHKHSQNCIRVAVQGMQCSHFCKPDSSRPLQAGLYAIMGCMRDVRVRAQRTDAMFDPLMETVAVLQKYGIQVTAPLLLRNWDDGRHA